MKKTHIFLTLLAVALATGLLFVSCPTESKSESKSSGPDAALNGTWVYELDMESSTHEVAIIFNNGNYETRSDGRPGNKGTYTTSGSSLTRTTTHIHGGSYIALYPDVLDGSPTPYITLPESQEWYTKTEVKTAVKASFPDDFGAEWKPEYDKQMDDMFAPQTVTYSVSGNTLTLGEGDHSLTLTKK